MILRAAFFDRDNTLLHMDPALRAARTAKIEGWTGRPYHLRGDDGALPAGGIPGGGAEIRP